MDELKKKGLLIVQVDRKSFIDAVLKSATPESLGFTRADYSAFTRHLVAPLEKFNVPEPKRRKLMAFIASLESQIVEK